MKYFDRIYLQVDPDGDKPECIGDEDITWCEDRMNDTDIEYVRADLVNHRPTPPAPDSEGRCVHPRGYIKSVRIADCVANRYKLRYP